MRIRGLICIAVGLMLTVAAACAEEVTVAANVLGPEGPLFVDGNLYYVAWTSGTLSKWDGKTTTVLNSLPGCSHNGLAFTKQKTFLLACTDEHGAITITSDGIGYQVSAVRPYRPVLPGRSQETARQAFSQEGS